MAIDGVGLKAARKTMGIASVMPPRMPPQLFVLAEQRGKPYAMHGEQVAVGTVLTLLLAELLSDEDIDFDAARAAAAAYDAEQWQCEIRRAYGAAADAIIELEAQSGKNGTAARLHRIDTMEAHWGEIRAMLKGVYSSAKLRELLKYLGCPADPDRKSVV